MRGVLSAFWVAIALVGLTCAPAVHACGPMQATNPTTGNLERVTLHFDGQDYEVRWAERVSGVWQEATLTDNSVADTCPRLAFFPDGSSGVSWIEGGTTIRYLGRDDSLGWQQSTVTVTSGTAQIDVAWLSVHDNEAHLVWSAASGSTQTIVAGGTDGPGPWPGLFSPNVLATTTYAGSSAPQVTSESGHLWAVWIHDGDELAYSEHDETNGWGSVLYESYSGPTDIPAAKERVADDVTQ